MQTQGVNTDELPFEASAGVTYCATGNNVQQLKDQIAYFVTQLISGPPPGPFPNSVLIDIGLAGGGAGNVFMATLLTNNGTGGTPSNEKLANMTFHWIEAPNATEMNLKIQIFRAGLTAQSALWAWDVACAGDGAVWIAVFVTWETSPG